MKTRIDMYGPVSFSAIPYAQERLAGLDRVGDAMIVDVRLVQLPAPAVTKPAIAQANLTWRGHFLEAHATGTTMCAAIDLLHDRLRCELARATNINERRATRVHAVGA